MRTKHAQQVYVLRTLIIVKRYRKSGHNPDVEERNTGFFQSGRRKHTSPLQTGQILQHDPLYARLYKVGLVLFPLYIPRHGIRSPESEQPAVCTGSASTFSGSAPPILAFIIHNLTFFAFTRQNYTLFLIFVIHLSKKGGGNISFEEEPKRNRTNQWKSTTLQKAS
jgi:hypothetical protein